MSRRARHSLRVFVMIVVMLSARLAIADPIVYTHTLDFPSIQAFGTFTTGTYLFPQFSTISKIRMTFSTVDSDFNGAIGPTGGDSGVEIGVLSSSRFGLSSVVPGNQVLTLFPYADPQHRFEKVMSLVKSGGLTVSLGAFENFNGCCSRGFILDEPSSLKLEVMGELAATLVPEATPVPEPVTLSLLSLGVGALAARRRRLFVRS